MEPSDLSPDVVGQTSARLLAAGIDRRERLDALHLLAVLDASTDSHGIVRRPIDDLTGEFELPPLSVMRSIDHLQRVGAVDRDEDDLVVLGHREDWLGGMRLAEFLDDVRASFDRDETADLDAVTSRRRWPVRAGPALVAAAAVVTVLAIGPTSQPTTEQLAAGGPTTTASSLRRERPSTTVGPAAAGGPTTTASSLPREGPSTTVGPAAAAPSTTSPTPSAAAEPSAGPAPEVSDAPLVATGCPEESPVAAVVDGILRISNPTDEDVTITSLSVDALGVGLPVVVPAGASVERPLPTRLAEPPQVDEWSWTDPATARTCPM